MFASSRGRRPRPNSQFQRRPLGKEEACSARQMSKYPLLYRLRLPGEFRAFSSNVDGHESGFQTGRASQQQSEGLFCIFALRVTTAMPISANFNAGPSKLTRSYKKKQRELNNTAAYEYSTIMPRRAHFIIVPNPELKPI